MPQSSNANAFRQRAERLGYQQIVIEKISADWYLITVREPLAGHVIVFECSNIRLKNLLRGSNRR